jgi:hypothetical protein
VSQVGHPASRSLLGAARAPLAVAGARLRSRPVRPILVVTGVALAVAMLVSVLGGGLVARQQALGRTLAAVPASTRAFEVDRFGVLDHDSFRNADARARQALATVSPGPVRRLIFFRELRVGGELVEPAAVDDLARVVRLRSGRLPRTCTRRRCELLQIGGGGSARLEQAGIRLQRVGIASLRDPALRGYFAAATGSGSERPTLLLGPSVDALQRLGSVALFYRVYSWFSALSVHRLRTWDVGRILAAESRAQVSLEAANTNFKLSGPDAALLDASRRGRITARRLALIGGETSALLLGFAAIAAIGLRRGVGSERRRLWARGARRWQIGLALGAEIGSMTLAGVLLGLVLGAVVVAAIAGSAGLQGGAILGHLFTGSVVAALAVGWLVVTLLVGLATATEDREGGQRRIGLVDVAALGAAATIVVALSRGALDPESVASGNTVLLLSLPALVCFVVAVVLARLLTPAMRSAERLTRQRSISLRLAVLALVRAPSRTVVSCAFIAIAVGLALFAASYRATLDRGAADQAAFDVPLDFTVSEGSKLVRPLDAAPLASYERLGGAYAVLRTSGTTPGSGSSILSPTVLGIPAAAMRQLHWRSDFSALSPGTIARRLAPDGEPRLASLELPAGTTTVSFPARAGGAALDVRLVTRDDRGRTTVLPLGVLSAEAKVLSARIPRGATRILGLELMLPANEQFALAHRETEAQVATAPSGELELGPLRAGRRVLTAWRGWVLPAGGVTRLPGHVQLRYTFQATGARLPFRPAQETDGRPMPVIASPDVARAAGGLGGRTVLDLQDTTVPARVVGIATRLPTVGSGPSVLADRGWLSTAIDANAPGEGRPNEVWLSASNDRAAAAALRRPPFASLVVASRARIERRLATDPLAHATALALAAGGIVALALAVLGFWVAIVSELRDERSDFFDLEAQGVPPASLRAQLLTRGLILNTVGLAGGIVLAAILSRLVVSLVRVSATTGVPQPPLRLDVAWLVSGLGVVALAVAAFLVAEGTSLAAFRSVRPERAPWSLE